MSDEAKQLDIETGLDEQEEGFDGWDIFGDDDTPRFFGMRVV